MTLRADRDRSRPVLTLIRHRPKSFLLAATGWLLYHTWPLLPGLLAMEFFNLLQHHAVAGLNLQSLIGLVVAAGLARIIIIFSASVTAGKWRFVARSLIQRNIITRIMSLPGACAMPYSVNKSVSTLRDDAEAIAMMGDWSFDSISAVSLAAGGFAIMLAVNVRITLIVVPPIAAVVTIAYLARKKLSRLRESNRAASANVTGTVGDFVSAARSIQVAAKEDAVIAHLKRLSSARMRAVLRDEMLSAWLDAVFANASSWGTGLTLLVAVSAMRSGQFTVGDFVLFSNYLMQVAQYTGFIGYLIRTRRQAQVSFTRATELMQGETVAELVEDAPVELDEVMDRRPPRNPGARDTDRLESMSVRGLTVRAGAAADGVSNISLDIARGTLTVITGRVGSGKTTLLRGILGLLPSESGEILWNNRVIASPDTFLVPPQAAYTPQIPALLSGTLRDNVLLSSNPEMCISDAIHCAMLDNDVAQMPDGLDTEIGVRGVRLSGGQIQRTAAARMLVQQAELVVFDDLSSALDVETEQGLWEQIFGREGTYVVVSHRRTLLERADQVIVLRAGRLICRGRLAEIIGTCPDLQMIYRTQDDTASAVRD
jgi:ATP-binding cassette, subfamily B, bacterial